MSQTTATTSDAVEQYEVVFVSVAADAVVTAERRDELVAEHHAYLADLRRRGLLAANGPVIGGPFSGLQIYRAGSVDAAMTLVAEDPAIRAGLLSVQTATWRCPAGCFTPGATPAP